MSVDEILADPDAAVELPADSMVTHVIVIVEYLEPASSNLPRIPRLKHACDDALALHVARGMLLDTYDEVGEPDP